MFPYKVDVAMRQLPWANWAIIAVTVAISVFGWAVLDAEPYLRMHLWARDGQEKVDEAFAQFEKVREQRKEAIEKAAEKLPPEAIEEYRAMLEALSGGRFLETMKKAAGFEPWQLFSHAFIHGGFFHLLGNMWFLFLFGNAINSKLGHSWFCLLYLCFAVVTGIAWFLAPGNGWMLLGASGAVMGAAGMFIVLYPLNEVSVVFFFLFRPFFFHVSAVWVLLGYLALDTLGFLSSGSDVAHISHITGMLTGAGVASALVMAGVIKPGAGEKTLLEIIGIKVPREPGSEPKPIVKPQTAASYLARPEAAEAMLKKSAREGFAELAPLDIAEPTKPPLPEADDEPVELAPLEVEEDEDDDYPPAPGPIRLDD